MTDTGQPGPVPPQVTLIGATGGMGTYVLKEFLRRGNHVRSVSRHSDVTSDDHVGIARADVYEVGALAEALAGAHTVVSAFNPGWQDPDLYNNYLLGARNVQNAAKAAHVPRLIVIGGASSLYGPDGRQLIESAEIPEPFRSGVRAARDYHAEILTEDEIDWVFLSPPPDCGPMGPTGRRGKYRVGTEEPVADNQGKSSISREDLAVALVDEALVPVHHRQRFTVGY